MAGPLTIMPMSAGCAKVGKDGTRFIFWRMADDRTAGEWLKSHSAWHSPRTLPSGWSFG